MRPSHPPTGRQTCTRAALVVSFGWLLCLVGVYVHWKRCGGTTGYTAPGSDAEKTALAAAHESAQARREATA